MMMMKEIWRYVDAMSSSDVHTKLLVEITRIAFGQSLQGAGASTPGAGALGFFLVYAFTLLLLALLLSQSYIP